MSVSFPSVFFPHPSICPPRHHATEYASCDHDSCHKLSQPKNTFCVLFSSAFVCFHLISNFAVTGLSTAKSSLRMCSWVVTATRSCRDLKHTFCAVFVTFCLFSSCFFLQPSDCPPRHQASECALGSWQLPQVGRFWTRQDLRLQCLAHLNSESNFLLLFSSRNCIS